MVKGCPGRQRPSNGRTAGMSRAVRLATPRTCPPPALTAMIVADPLIPASARVAACWTPLLIVVRTLVDRSPDHLCSTLICLPAALCTTTSVVGLPASLPWYACSRPDSPIVVPGRYGSAASLSVLAVSVGPL